MGTPVDISTLNQLQPFSLQGVRAYTASSGDWPTGGYQCAVVGLTCEQSEKGGLMFVVKLQSKAGKLANTPDNAGKDITQFIGKPKTKWVSIPGTAPTAEKEVHYRAGMRAFLESLGVAAATLDTQIRASEIATFAMGRDVFVWNIENTAELEGDTQWMTPKMWTDLQAGQWEGKKVGKVREGEGNTPANVVMPTIAAGMQTGNALAAQAQAQGAPTGLGAGAFNPTLPAPLAAGQPIAPALAALGGAPSGGALGAVLAR